MDSVLFAGWCKCVHQFCILLWVFLFYFSILKWTSFCISGSTMMLHTHYLLIYVSAQCTCFIHIIKNMYVFEFMAWYLLYLFLYEYVLTYINTVCWKWYDDDDDDTKEYILSPCIILVLHCGIIPGKTGGGIIT